MPAPHIPAGDASGGPGTFRLEVSTAERAWLLDLVRRVVLDRLGQEGDAPRTSGPPDGPDGPVGVDGAGVPAPPPGVLHRSLGAFVTFKKDGRLRGCIGSMVGDGPLYLTVARMARAAAFEDPRFPPVTVAEAPGLELEISVLGPLTRCPDPALVRVGRHGLLVRRGDHSGVLLPQVPLEWGWDRETFLAQTCRKAGLPPDTWQEPDTGLYWFEAEVFGDR